MAFDLNTVTGKVGADIDNTYTKQALEMALSWIGLSNGTSVEVVNHGGQGVIFKVTAAQFPQPLLLKIPYYARHEHAQTIERSILKEARIAQALSQRNFAYAPAYITHHGDGKYFMRQFIQGTTLLDKVATLDEEERMELVLALFALSKEAFSLFHQNPVTSYVIRDYKLKNMIQDHTGNLFFIDYGSCREEANMVPTGRKGARKRLGMGAFLHWPVEQLCEDQGNCDRRVDYFAWGVMAYYVLFSKYPYDNLCKNPGDVMAHYKRSYEQVCQCIAQLQNRGAHTAFIQRNLRAALHPDCHYREFLQ